MLTRREKLIDLALQDGGCCPFVNPRLAQLLARQQAK